MSNIKLFVSHCEEFNVLGIQCSYSKKMGERLQLATYKGLCMVIELRKLESVPVELKVR